MLKNLKIAIDKLDNIFWVSFYAGVIWGGFECSFILTRNQSLFSALSFFEATRLVFESSVFYGLIASVLFLGFSVFIFLVFKIFKRDIYKKTLNLLALYIFISGIVFLFLAWLCRKPFLRSFLRPFLTHRYFTERLPRFFILVAFSLLMGGVISYIFYFMRKKLFYKFAINFDNFKKPVFFAIFIILFFVLLLHENISASLNAGNIQLGSKSVVLIVADALRADHLSCYGYSRPTSPNIDILADEGILFKKAVTQFPATEPSFGSMFTAKYPRRHELVMMDPRYRLKDISTMAEILRKEGYLTAAIMRGSLGRNSGLARGFDLFFEEAPDYRIYNRNSKWETLRGRLLVSRAWIKFRKLMNSNLLRSEIEGWIRKNKERPFFLFVHLFDPHAPYAPPKKYIDMFNPDYQGKYCTFFNPCRYKKGSITPTKEEIEQIIALYDAEIRFLDESITGIIKILKETNILDNTLVIITADHGEELYEHKLFEHGHMYNTNLLVPLIMYCKDSFPSGKKIEEPVELIDIMPTVLDILNIPSPIGIDGETLMPLVEREDSSLTSDDIYAFSEEYHHTVATGYNKKIAVQNRQWKFMIDSTNGRRELYNLEKDPFEYNNCYDEYPAAAVKMEKVLLEWDKSQPTLESIKRYKEDKETKQRLRALGYL